MEFRKYQSEAAKTDQLPDDEEKGKVVALLGLAGEVGSLLSEYKKFLRDGKAHQRFDKQVAEELGDLLWYISSVATKFDISLEEIATGNLAKNKSRWPRRRRNKQGKLFEPNHVSLFDEQYPSDQQIPRKVSVTFMELREGGSARVIISCNGTQIGDALTDNAYEDDGYRFHDVFHLSYAAILGWSPIIRKLLGVKRKSDRLVDEVEDGARARIIEELISHLVHAYAREHEYLDGVSHIDYHLLKTIQSLVDGREVGIRSLADWEDAIFAGYKVWRRIRLSGGGIVEVDLLERCISFRAIES